MSARSLNRVQLIGNLTRDPELRYTPSGTAVVTFGLATNRAWTTDNGERKEEAEFHRIVAWSKLAELCSQLLKKGRKVFVEGRLQTRNWQGQDGNQRTTTEIVISDMIILDSRRDGDEGSYSEPTHETTSANDYAAEEHPVAESVDKSVQDTQSDVGDSEQTAPKQSTAEEVVNPDDIPF